MIKNHSFLCIFMLFHFSDLGLCLKRDKRDRIETFKDPVRIDSLYLNCLT